MMDEALPSDEYDVQWQRLGDFIRYNPGARHRRRLSLRMLEGVRAEAAADIGCGLGELLTCPKQARPDIQRFVGADFAAKTVKRVRAALPWAEIHELDLTQGALNDTFELVTCSEVIEHLTDQAQAVANLAKMVAPGGHLLITCPTGRIFATERHFGHVKHPTPSDLERWGAAAGLVTQEAISWGFPAYLMVKHAANLNPELAIRQFGSGHFNSLQKLINHALYVWSFASWPSRRACQLFWLYRKPT
jgi:SAM-dependent methyltransferase